MTNLLTSLLLAPKARAGWRLALLVLLCVISYLALTPVPPKEMDTGWDKANHFLAFASLAFSGCWSVSTARLRWLFLPLLLVAYGGAIELIQMLVPGRSSEWADLLADSIGISIGLAFAWLVLKALRR